MKHYPTVLSIAGSHNTGEAGIQSDIETFIALGAQATTVITAIALQCKSGIKSIHSIPGDIIRSQIEFVMENASPDVVKIGLISEAGAASIIADCLRKYHPRYVVYDPVMIMSESMNIPDDETMKVIKNDLLHFSNLMTINLAEAELFTGIKSQTTDDIKEIARTLAEQYRIPILVKAANFLETGTYDALYNPDGENWEFLGDKINTSFIHGASSLFSAAIATYLALGEKLNIAVKSARQFSGLVINHQQNTQHGQLKISEELLNSVFMKLYNHKE